MQLSSTLCSSGSSVEVTPVQACSILSLPHPPLRGGSKEQSTRFIPVHPETKRPLLKGWPEHATSSLGKVRAWLRRGYRLGMTLEGLVALDMDPAEAYFGLSLDFGLLPQTWWQETPRGGRHYLFADTGGGDHFEQVRSQCPWREYPEGNVDIKAGRGAFIVLYKEVPDLGRVAPLPEWLELPRGRCSNGSPPCGVEHWYPLVSETRHYRMCELTARLLRNDAERIAESVSGQEPLLASIGYTWGLKVKAGYVGAREALQVLMKGAERMKNTNPAWPWDMREVRAKLRAAIQRGAE